MITFLVIKKGPSNSFKRTETNYIEEKKRQKEDQGDQAASDF